MNHLNYNWCGYEGAQFFRGCGIRDSSQSFLILDHYSINILN